MSELSVGGWQLNKNAVVMPSQRLGLSMLPDIMQQCCSRQGWNNWNNKNRIFGAEPVLVI